MAVFPSWCKLPKCPVQYKDYFSRNRNSHHKDNTIMTPSYSIMGILISLILQCVHIETAPNYPHALGQQAPIASAQSHFNGQAQNTHSPDHCLQLWRDEGWQWHYLSFVSLKLYCNDKQWNKMKLDTSMYFNSLNPGEVTEFICDIFKLSLKRLISYAPLWNWLTEECNKTPLVISQHWRRFGPVMQQAMFCTNVDRIIWCHMMSPGGNELIVIKYKYAVQCRYNAGNFLQNSHERHCIARPSGRGMRCLLWVQPLIGILPQFLQWFVPWHVILDRVITALDCTRHTHKF